MMDIFENIREIAESTYNIHLDEAKKSGRKIMGYFCSYIPEEVIHAAGFIPYRIKAVESTGTEKADIFFSPLNCTYVRRCFDNALRGKYEFLDGMVFMNGCDHIRRIYDNWRDARKKSLIKPEPDFLHMFVVPHILGAHALRRYVDEINKLIKSIEDRFEITITDEALKESIRLYNKKRNLIRKIYEKRSRSEVPVSGSEIMSLMLAITSLPVETANELLEEINKCTDNRNVSSGNGLRVMVTGGCMEEIEHIEMIESEGAIVVADNICLGSRHFNHVIDESADTIEGIAERYLFHISCPRMIDDFDRRMEFLTATMEEYNVDAVIAEKLMFCDLWGGEIFLLRQEAKRLGFPILALERELYVGSTGQLKTRVQAFLEQVRNIKAGAEISKT